MKTLIKYIPIIICFLGFFSCEADKRYPPRGYIPNTPKATEQLEAAYFWTPQNKVNSSYWKDANYVEVALSDISKQKLYPDGYLNMTGTYSGMKSFNKGKDPKVKLKAGYDNEYLYILVEWKDTTADASNMTWLWQGPSDKYKEDSATGWTSQRNNDNVSLLFNNTKTGAKDVWKWSMAYTAPFDMALYLKADNGGNILDEHKPLTRNSIEENSRSGPMYEWNGVRQEITLPNGEVKVLDPAYYLSDNYKMPVPGDISQGETVFNITADCKYCHGHNGNGISEGFSDGGLLADVFTNKYTREGLIEFIGSSQHEGAGGQYFGKIKNDAVKVENLITFLRGIAGTPGNLLITPESEPQIRAVTNIAVGGIEKQNKQYLVLFRKKLASDNSNDISFDPGSTYTFSVRFSDNDEINYVGASNIELTFKSSEL